MTDSVLREATSTTLIPSTGKIHRALMNPRSRCLLLQSLVSIILSYELLFGSESIISRFLSDGLVISLWLLIPAIAFVPSTVLDTPWFSALLVAIDTLLVTATIYLSGNARPDLYITYFVLMLLAASVRKLSHLLALSLLLSVGYAAVLYESVLQSGTLTVGHLLGVPVLMVMAVFYGVALEAITVERAQNSTLRRDVEVLQKTEAQLTAETAQLEGRIAALKANLTKSEQTLQAGLSMRQTLERRLRHAQKMEVVGQVAAGIANEFSSLFSVIGTQTGLLLSQMKPDDPLRRSVDDLFKSGDKAAALTAELMALNANRVPMRQIVSIRKVLQELEAEIKSLVPARIELEISSDDASASAEVDREGLEQILFHLIVNARDAMPQKGRLTIEVKTVVAQERERSATRGPSSHIVVAVRDTGSGMSLDTQAKIFDPFFSTKETNLGLGLTVIYGTVKQNGGTLDVDSRPGQGTEVRVSFPAALATPVPDQPLVKGLLAKGDETILLVDEDEISRKLAVSILARHHYHVLEAGSSTEALLLAQQHTGSVQLTVSPLLMHEIGGRELARRLLRQHPTMKALFVSSYDEDSIGHHRINRNCVLQHPYRQTGLIQKVRDVLDAT
jgi:two-component system, cell cycle sensor histidine kinase and response regulator CckA